MMFDEGRLEAREWTWWEAEKGRGRVEGRAPGAWWGRFKGHAALTSPKESPSTWCEMRLSKKARL